MKLSTPNLASLGPFALLLLIGVLFTYYYMSYIPNRTEELDQHNLRLLKRINVNVKERYVALKNNTGHLSQRILKGYTNGNIEILEYDNFISFKDFYGRDQNRMDSSAMKKQMSELSDSLRRTGISFTKFPDSYQVKVKEALSYLFRRDKFDKFLILKYKEQTPSFDNLSRISEVNNIEIKPTLTTLADLPKKAKIIFQDELTGAFDHEFDTLFKHSKKYGSGVINKSLAGTGYRLYFQELDLDDQSVVLCGLVKAGKFNNAKSQVSLTLLVVLIMIALLVALALPALKLVIANRFERTSKSDVFTISLTTMISIGVLSLFIYFTLHQVNYQKHTKEKRLKSLAESVEKNLLEELGLILLQSKTINSVITNLSGEKLKLSHENLLNNPIVILGHDDNNQVKTISASGNSKGSQKGYVGSVPDMPQGTASVLKGQSNSQPKYGFKAEAKSIDDSIRKYGHLDIEIEKLRTRVTQFNDAHKSLISDIFLYRYDSAEDSAKKIAFKLCSDFDYWRTIVNKLSKTPALYPNENLTSDKTLGPSEKLNQLESEISQLTQYAGIYYPFYNSFSLVGNFQQNVKWETNKKNTERVQDLKGRLYITAITKQKAWSHPQAERYYFEPVFSRSTGKVSTEVSMDNGGLMVNGKLSNISVISTKLYSLSKPLFPTGLEYAIIDASGEVKYHIDERYVLQENFFEECDATGILKAAIRTNGSQHGETNYHAQGIQYYIQPIKNTGYFLIVYSPKRFHNSILLHSLSSSFLLFTLIIALLLVLSYLHHIFVLPKYLYIRRPYFLDWLRPKSSDTFVDNCLLLFFAQLVVVSLVFWFGYSASFEHSLYGVFAAFITPIILFPFSYNMLNLKRLGEMTWNQRIRSLVPTVLLLVIINFVLHVFFEGYKWLVLAAIELMIATLTLVLVVSPLIKRKVLTLFKGLGRRIIRSDRMSKLTGFRHRYYPYYLVLSLWMLFIAVIPTAVFVKHCYQAETILFTAYQELEMAKRIKTKFHNMNERWNGIDLLDKKITKWNYINKCSNYATQTFDCTISSSAGEHDAGIQGSMLEILPAIRPQFDSIAFATDYIFQKSNHFWMEGSNVYYQDYPDCHNCAKNTVLISSKNNYIIDAEAWVIPIGILALLFFIILIFVFIKFVSKRLFAIDTIIHQKVMDNIEHPLSLAHHMLIWYPSKVFPKSVERIFDGQPLDSLDAHIQDPNLLVSFLTKWANKIKKSEKDKKKILLQSSFNIEAFDEFILNKIGQVPEQDQPAWEQVKYAWDTLKASLTEVSCSIQKSIDNIQKAEVIADSIITKALNQGSNYVENYELKLLKKSITKELKQSDTLLVVGQNIAQQIKIGEKISFERIVLMLEVGAAEYYHSLWNHCSKLEKFILYDLAMDGYVNTQNENTILKLCQKGLVTYENSLQVMNDSFRNYVLNNVKPEMVKEINKIVAEKGRWRKFRTPLVFFLVAVASFIFITQEEVFSKSVAFLTTILTILPALLRFLPSSRISSGPIDANP